MKRIESSCFGIVVELTDPDPEHEGCWKNGNITSDLHEKPTDEDDDPTLYNAAMDGIESLVLAAACAGIDITTPAFECAIDTAVMACGENF